MSARVWACVCVCVGGGYLCIFTTGNYISPIVSKSVSLSVSDRDICLNFLLIFCSDHDTVVNHTHYALFPPAEQEKSNLQPDPEEVIHSVMPINNLKG